MEVNKIYQHEDGRVVLAVSKDLSELNRENYIVAMAFNTRPPIIWNYQKLKFYTDRMSGFYPDKVFGLWDFEWDKYTEIGEFKKGKTLWKSQNLF